MNFLGNRNLLVALILIVLGFFAYLIVHPTSITQVIRLPGQPIIPPVVLTPTTGPTVTPEREANIIVVSPGSGDRISSPVRITGQARVFENTLQVRVKDGQGKVLATQTVMAQSPDTGLFGPYETVLTFPTPATTGGTVEAFQFSAKDGSEIDKVSIPVVFEMAQTQDLQAFFSHAGRGGQNCQAVFAVERQVPRTQAVARAALEELLKGPTTTERAQGFTTNIPTGVQIQRLTIENGTAQADFNEALNQVGGSCRVTAIRSQITQTLQQFPNVQSVVISINGRTEDILQP